MSRRAPSLARNSAPDPQVSFVHPNRSSVLSEVEEENEDFETVETKPSSVRPKNYEVGQAPRSRNQKAELRTRPGRKLNLDDKTTSTFSPVEPRNREVSGFSDQDLVFASQPPVNTDNKISNVSFSTHLEELLRFRGEVDGQEAVFLLDLGSTHDFISAEFVSKHGVETRTLDGDLSVTLADGRFTSETRMCTVPLAVKIADENENQAFTVFPLARYDVIFGRPWLSKNNPEINFQTNEVRIGSRPPWTARRTLHQESPGDDSDIQLNFISGKQARHALRQGDDGFLAWVTAGNSAEGMIDTTTDTTDRERRDLQVLL